MTNITDKGKPISANIIEARGLELMVRGKFFKMAQVKGEYHHSVEDVESVLKKLRTGSHKADVFTFIQRLPDTEPRFDYPYEMDNLAVLPVSTYENWWKVQMNDKTRNMVRKSGKKGVVIKEVPFDDELVKGIVEIYNESPVRQGKPFWHYGKKFDQVKRENASYLDRCSFIGAFLEGKLIGYVKVIYTDRFAYFMQIVSMIQHRDLAPNNGLVAKTVELVAERNLPSLVYQKYEYGKKGTDPLTRFKKHNGFSKVEYPRYYIPLTLKGRLVLALGLHKGLLEKLPFPVLKFMITLRARWYARQS